VTGTVLVCCLAQALLFATVAGGLPLESYTHVIGVVTSSDGTPLTGVRIHALSEKYPGDWWTVGSGESQADGSYDCVIWDDESPSYRIIVADPSGRHAPQFVGSNSVFTPEDAALYPITSGQTLAGVNVSLEPGASISGHVRSRDTMASLVSRKIHIAQAWVELPGGGEWRAPHEEALLVGQVDTEGAFIIGGLESTQYRVQFRDSGATPSSMNGMHQWLYHGDEADPARASDVSVSGTQTVSGISISPVPAQMRIAGPDRYQTALSASRHTFGCGGARSVVIASGETFPDGLAASALAGSVRGPVLLTTRDALPPGLAEELVRLEASTVYLVGGTRAVSDHVLTLLDSMSGVNVVRIAGEDRYETAALIAQEAATLQEEPSRRAAFIVRGDEFADALTASCFGYSAGIPIVLTRSDALPDTTRAMLQGLGIEDITIVGGTSAVGEAVRDELESEGLTVRRVSGTDRYATSLALAQRGVANGWSGTKFVGLATGRDFADGISGGAASGAAHGVLLLVGPSSDDVSSALRAWGLDAYWRGDVVTVFGGSAAVGQVLENEVREGLAPSSYE
jgi:putative cell wall-binding protein